jgi:hypothetical protein
VRDVVVGGQEKATGSAGRITDGRPRLGAHHFDDRP